MACTNNYPVNLVDTQNSCDLTCNLTFDYKDSSIVVNNESGVYISITYEQTSKPNLIFSSVPYHASELRIYVPSLHTYNGKHTDAELLINHNGNNNKHLIVSVPIVNKNYISSSGSTLAKIIELMAKQRMNDFTQPLSINNFTINLNSIVPEKPFYYYKGCADSPYLFTKTNVDIVAFNSTNNNNGAIIIDDNFMKNLTALLPTPNKISTSKIDISELFYNMNGPSNSKKDDIYIDCQPTNEEGDVYVPTKSSEPPNIFGFFNKGVNSKELFIIQSIIGLLIMFIILWVAKSLMILIIGKFSRNSNQGGGSINNFFK